MPGELAILNPRARRRRRKSKPKEAKPKMATRRRRHRKMTAKQLQYFGKRKRKSVVVMSSNPKRRHRRRRRHAALFSANPRRRFRRFRRNPITRGSGLIGNSLIPGAIGAGGAIGVDWVLANFGQAIPVAFRTQQMMPFVRVAAALGVGWAVSAMADEEAGAEAAAGGIVVALYPWFRSIFAGALSGTGLAGVSGLGRYLKGNPAMQRQRLARLGFQRLRRLNGIARGAAVAAHQQRALLHGLGTGNPNNSTKFRVLRDGQASARMGYIGPARTLGRYLQR